MKCKFILILLSLFFLQTGFAQEEEVFDDFEDTDVVEESVENQDFPEESVDTQADDLDFESEEEQDTQSVQDDPLEGEEGILDQIEELNKFSESTSLKPFIYAERGRKDPFSKPSGVQTEVSDIQAVKKKSTGLEGYDLSAFKVTAVLWDIKYPKALIKSPNDEIFQIEEGTKIGRNSGYVAKIREGEVVIIETSMPNGDAGQKFYKTQVLKLGR